MSHFWALQMIGASFEIAGILAFATAARYRKRDAPSIPSEEPRNWKPVWFTRDRFIEDRGYRFNVLGGVLCGCGALAAVIGFLLE